MSPYLFPDYQLDQGVLQQEINRNDYWLDASHSMRDQHLRWKCTAPGTVTVSSAVLENLDGGGCCDFGEIVQNLRNQGFQRTDRVYMVYIARDPGNSNGILTKDSSSNEIFNDAPYIWYRLNETNPASNVAADISGNGLNGTYQNAPQKGARGLVNLPVYDPSIDFRNAENEWVEGPTVNMSSTALTMEAFIEPWDFPGDISTVAGIEESGSNIALLRIGDAGIERDRLQFVLGVNGIPYRLNGPRISRAHRYHVVATYDGRQMLLYVNGRSSGSLQVVAASQPKVAASANGVFRISKSFGMRFFDGLIDEVAVYGKVLSQPRVAAHFGAYTGGVAAAGCCSDTPEPAYQPANSGPSYAVTLDPRTREGGTPPIYSSATLHELLHALGAVMWTAKSSNDLDSSNGGAPHGHCFEYKDIMCYPDGDWKNKPVQEKIAQYPNYNQTLDLVVRCSSGYPAWHVDCNYDDYWNPELNAHIFSREPNIHEIWNVSRSSFLTMPLPDPGLGGN